MSATVTRKLPGLPTVDSNNNLAGEIIAWDLTGMKVRYSDLSHALSVAGFDPSVNRSMLPQNAFRRACKILAEKRLIRRVDEDDTGIKFQFTAERHEGDGLAYDREAVLTIDKTTGEIIADGADLAERARIAIDEQMGIRSASDVSRIIHKLCETQNDRSVDLVPIGKNGTFWTRPGAKPFVDQVEMLIDQLNGSMTRLPIALPAPNTTASRNIKEAVADKIGSLIAELNETVEEFGEDARNKSLESAAEKVKLIKFKAESYSEYLEDEKARLDAELKQATDRLRAKVKEIVAGREAAR